MLQDRKKKLAMIHIAKKELQLDDGAYRAILEGCGFTSSSEIETENQYRTVINCFKKLGFRPTPSKKSNTAFKNKVSGGSNDEEFITRKQEYYIRGLWDLASRAKDEKSLNQMIKRIGGVIDISMLPKSHATKVIVALRKICWEAGFNPDKRPKV